MYLVSCDSKNGHVSKKILPYDALRACSPRDTCALDVRDKRRCFVDGY
jgi:hypothetical protein